MNKKHIILFIFIFILTLLSSYAICYFPIQKHLAEKNFQKYIQKQNISIDNIKYKEFFKNYKDDGYTINIIYNDDPQITYSYSYIPFRKDYPFNILLDYNPNYPLPINYDLSNLPVKHKKLIYPIIKTIKK